jgi:UDP-arabinose 4-epimerase
VAVEVLVTGGAGYIGSHVCKALAHAGLVPVTFDNLATGHRWAVKWGPLVEGDLGVRAAIQHALRAHRIAAVLHFAGSAYVGESMHDPGKYFLNNTANTLNLLEAMRSVGVERLVFSSTCATYGEPKVLPIGEDHPQRPVSPYGESKLFVERMLEWYARAHGLRYATLRYFNAAGSDPAGEIGEDHDPETHLIPLVIAAAQGRTGGVSILGTDYPTADGTAVRDYIHVSDLADAHVRAVQRLLAGAGSIRLNLGTGQGHSVREVIRAVQEVGGRPVPFLESGRRAGDPPLLVAAPGQAQAFLGWRPRRSDLHTLVETAWKWHAAHDSCALPSATAA